MIPASRVQMALTALAVLLQAGCSGSLTRPTIPLIELSLKTTRVTGTPSFPPVVEVSLRNVGTATVWHCAGCGCESMISLLGPDGAPVYFYDPSAPPPLCPIWVAPFEPGQESGGPFVFTGTLYEAGHSWPSPTYTAPAGAYTVIARYWYATRNGPEGPTNWVLLERRATVNWTP